MNRVMQCCGRKSIIAMTSMHLFNLSNLCRQCWHWWVRNEWAMSKEWARNEHDTHFDWSHIGWSGPVAEPGGGRHSFESCETKRPTGVKQRGAEPNGGSSLVGPIASSVIISMETHLNVWESTARSARNGRDGRDWRLRARFIKILPNIEPSVALNCQKFSRRTQRSGVCVDYTNNRLLR